MAGEAQRMAPCRDEMAVVCRLRDVRGVDYPVWPPHLTNAPDHFRHRRGADDNCRMAATRFQQARRLRVSASFGDVCALPRHRLASAARIGHARLNASCAFAISLRRHYSYLIVL